MGSHLRRSGIGPCLPPISERHRGIAPPLVAAATAKEREEHANQDQCSDAGYRSDPRQRGRFHRGRRVALVCGKSAVSRQALRPCTTRAVATVSGCGGGPRQLSPVPKRLRGQPVLVEPAAPAARGRGCKARPAAAAPVMRGARTGEECRDAKSDLHPVGASVQLAATPARLSRLGPIRIRCRRTSMAPEKP